MTGLLHIAVCDPNAGHRAALCDALAKLLFDTVVEHRRPSRERYYGETVILTAENC